MMIPMSLKQKIQQIQDVSGFWNTIGLTKRFIAVVAFRNLITKTLSGAALLLFIPIARGIINSDFSAVKHSGFYNFLGELVPFFQNLGDVGLFIFLAGLILCINIVANILSFRFSMLENASIFRITSNFTKIIFEKQLSFGKVFMDRINAGQYAMEVSMLPKQVNRFVAAATKLIASFLEIVVLFIVLSFISLKFALLSLLMFPAIIILFIYFKRKINASFKEEIEESLDLTKLVYNSVIRLPLIKMHGSEETELSAFKDKSRIYENKQLTGSKVRTLVQPVMESLSLVFLFIMAAFLGYATYKFDPSNTVHLVVFFVVFSRILQAVTATIQPFLATIENIKLFERIEKSLEQIASQEITEGTGVFPGIARDITIKNLRFKYKEKGKNILRGITATIHKNDITSIVGRSGAGKTTLVNLLLRLYESDDQSIFVDGIDIKTYTASSLREKFCYVSQDLIIFDDTLYNNLCYGLGKEISEEKVLDVLSKVQLLDFVANLDNGIHSEIGDRGIRLSGGERQRLSIARALLSNPEIVIFDEPTSSVDVITEMKIIDLIKETFKEKMIIIISHSYLTIKHADNVLVIDEGRVVESGPIETLLQADGLFSQSWNAQFDVPVFKKD